VDDFESHETGVLRKYSQICLDKINPYSLPLG
jgi:hypothetical protein